MSDGGGDIIIKGGSCEIHFDDGVFKKDENDPKKRRHKHDGRKITRVRVADESGTSRLDSSDDNGLKWTITVSTATT